ncbi:MAG: hypothetical protein KKA19_00615 [Candidatus Margulisbacteria bacterium]|nr:hypothetical protein [Candidatus Margulisiibacteriota bacterium]
MARKSTVFKRCQRCGEEKSLSDFYRNRRKSDGHNGICQTCQAIVNKNNR